MAEHQARRCYWAARVAKCRQNCRAIARQHCRVISGGSVETCASADLGNEGNSEDLVGKVIAEGLGCVQNSEVDPKNEKSEVESSTHFEANLGKSGEENPSDDLGGPDQAEPVDDYCTSHDLRCIFHESADRSNLFPIKVIDGFSGCGGNTIQLAKLFDEVISIDIDAVKIENLKKNAELCGVLDRISLINEDILTALPKLKVRY